METDPQISLDQLYWMTAYIYSDKNSERSPTATFSHFLEVCAVLTAQGRKKRREDFTLESALCKALAWYFPLMAKFNVASLEDLIFRKYPFACPYCRKTPHEEIRCKQVRGTDNTLDHDALRHLYQKNRAQTPRTLDQWQSMFNDIYPRNVDDQPGRSVLGLFEELGELAEALRVFDRHPKYLAGEAADVFSYLMGIANEHALALATDGREFSFQAAFIARYPGLCVHCGHQKCICPIIPDATVGRSAKELDLAPVDTLFSLSPTALEKAGKPAASVVLEQAGGYSTIAEHFPFDRGEINRALVSLCLRVAKRAEGKKPEAASKLRDLALRLGTRAVLAGSKYHADLLATVLESLQDVRPLLVAAVEPDDASLEGTVGRLLEKETCSIGIVTALPVEMAAMRLMLDTSQPYPVVGDPNEYVIGTIKSKDQARDHLMAVTLLKDKGNNSAAAAATNLLRSFPHITDVIMVGVAGAAPFPEDVSKHVRLGDVVVSQDVVQYDNVRVVGEGTTEPRTSPIRTSGRFIGRALMLESERLTGQYPWQSYIDRGRQIEGFEVPTSSSDILFSSTDPTTRVIHPADPTRREGVPKILLGRIGAANALVKDSKFRDKMRDTHDIRAFEMEGSGIADATWVSGASFLVIRGACDYCDSHKDKKWQPFAAVAAAAYARVLIESLQ